MLYTQALDNERTVVSRPAGALRIQGGENHFSSTAMFGDNSAENGGVQIRIHLCILSKLPAAPNGLVANVFTISSQSVRTVALWWYSREMPMHVGHE